MMASYLLVRCAAIFLCMQVAIAASEFQIDCQGDCQTEQAGAALLQVKHRIGASPIASPTFEGQKSLLSSMVRPDPWNCELIVEGDPRFRTCHLEAGVGTLDPQLMNCSADSSCNIEHANAFRTLLKVGALPCCPTPPYCAAPACAAKQDAPSMPAVCTKRSPAENLAYMKDPDVWPAVHGWGGANELDTLKLIDALGCKGQNCTKEPPFDLMLDLGANTGYYTEKLTVRNFAKNYLMVEANPRTKKILDDRWGSEVWKKTWFTQQIPADPAPAFQIINMALSNSDGVLDMCQTEPSFAYSDSCIVPTSSVDKLVPAALTQEFQEHYRQATTAFIKIDTEGMDELVLRGMERLLHEERGKYEDGSSRFLVNFLQFEWSPYLSDVARKRENFQEYDVKTVTQFLENIGFETFLIGPRFLPLSHGSYADEFKAFTDDPNNNAGVRVNYPNFDDRLCKGCNTHDHESFTGDIFAIRASHPRATELKIALGACKESKDFDMTDPQYSLDVMPPPAVAK